VRTVWRKNGSWSSAGAAQDHQYSPLGPLPGLADHQAALLPVPVLKDGRLDLFETDEHSQVIAKYLDSKLNLGLFPQAWKGSSESSGVTLRGDRGPDLQASTMPIIARSCRRPNSWNICASRNVNFGRGCLDQWLAQQKELVAQLTDRLVPSEQMLGANDYLLDSRPRFVDFDLWGMLANFLFSGHYKMPAAHPRLKRWYQRMRTVKRADLSREKLHFLTPTSCFTIPTPSSASRTTTSSSRLKLLRRSTASSAIPRARPERPHFFSQCSTVCEARAD